jgi:hypothetical protein
MWLRHTLARVLGSLRAYAAPEAAPLRNAPGGRINREIMRSGTRARMWLRHTLARVLGSLRAYGAPEAERLR